jgi:hypothetical protein
MISKHIGRTVLESLDLQNKVLWKMKVYTGLLFIILNAAFRESIFDVISVVDPKLVFTDPDPTFQ